MTHVPDELYLTRQRFPDLTWQVVPVPRDQGLALRGRGEDVYDTREQAYAVVRRKNMEPRT